MIAASVAPILATQGHDQLPATVDTAGLNLIGLLGCLFALFSSVLVWSILRGLGLCSAFAVALTLIFMRSRDSHIAAHLSRMAQSIGYTIAAGGPLLVGLLHDRTGGWGAVGILFSVICFGAVMAGLGAGRVCYVTEGPSSRA